MNGRTAGIWSKRLCALWLALTTLFDAGTSVAARPTVAIVMSSGAGPFVEAATVVQGVLRRSPLQPEILSFELEGSESNVSAVLKLVRRAEPAVVITIGTIATSSILAEPLDAPIVFSMVLYPEQSRFVGVPGREVTGASLDIPLDTQFATLRRLLPKAKRLGVLYHPTETGRIVEDARSIAPRHGFQLDARTVNEPAAAEGAFGQLIGQVDALWTVADSHVFSPQSTSSLILASIRSGVPMFGLSVSHVRSGAVAAISCDYADIGEQTAELALRVLRGEKASTIPPTVPRKTRFALNLKTAERLDLRPAQELIDEAVEVIR